MAKANGNGHAKRPEKVYRSYHFKLNRDPVIDRVQSLVEREHVKASDVAKISGVSATTLANWWGPKAKTRRPQYATVAAIISALGYGQKFVKTRKIDIAKEVERAAAEIAAAKAKLEKRRAAA